MRTRLLSLRLGPVAGGARMLLERPPRRNGSGGWALARRASVLRDHHLLPSLLRTEAAIECVGARMARRRCRSHGVHRLRARRAGGRGRAFVRMYHHYLGLYPQEVFSAGCCQLPSRRRLLHVCCGSARAARANACREGGIWAPLPCLLFVLGHGEVQHYCMHPAARAAVGWAAYRLRLRARTLLVQAALDIAGGLLVASERSLQLSVASIGSQRQPADSSETASILRDAQLLVQQQLACSRSAELASGCDVRLRLCWAERYTEN